MESSRRGHRHRAQARVNNQIDDAMPSSANLLKHAEPAERVAGTAHGIARGQPVVWQQIRGDSSRLRQGRQDAPHTPTRKRRLEWLIRLS